MLMKVHEILIKLFETFLSIIRIIRHTSFRGIGKIARTSNTCLIMGNGPSLTSSLEKNKDKLKKTDLLAVNFMGLTPEFMIYRPNLYVLCDPGFWIESPDTVLGEKVRKLYQVLADTTNWDLQLYLPHDARKSKFIKAILSSNKFIHVIYFNKTKIEGLRCFTYFTYSAQWGMPRAQNVLSAALMLCIYSGYKTIYLAGAENDWIKNLWVDANNRLRLDDLHFYDNTNQGNAIVLNTKMYEQFLSWYYAFKSYAEIAAFAHNRGINVINTNLTSFIDVFEKQELID